MIAVHVAQLLQAPVGAVRSYEFREDEPELRAEFGLRGPIEGSLKLTRTPHGILVDCRYRVELEQECGRCLESAQTTIDNQFSQEFVPSTNVFTGLPEQVAADPDEPRIDPNHILDATEVIRQDIVTQLPLQPLCRPECAGLCVVCGQNLNDAECGHTPNAEEGALGRLGELLARKLSQN
jgi:uncharacterized protein